MTTFLLSLLPASLWIYAVNILFQDGHLLEKQGKWMREKWPKYINKPAFDCAICMASVHGTIWFFIVLPYFYSVELHIKFWPLFVFCLCGLNTVINKLISKERIIVD